MTWFGDPVHSEDSVDSMSKDSVMRWGEDLAVTLLGVSVDIACNLLDGASGE